MPVGCRAFRELTSVLPAQGHPSVVPGPVTAASLITEAACWFGGNGSCLSSYALLLRNTKVPKKIIFNRVSMTFYLEFNLF